MGVMGGASSGLVDEVILFSSDVASSFAMGLETSIVDVSTGDGGLAAIAAGCVGVDRMSTPSSCISPSSILWSGLLVEFACLRFPLLEEFEGVDFRLFLLDERGIVDVVERILRDASGTCLEQSSCGTCGDQRRVGTRDLRTDNRIRVARKLEIKVLGTSRFN